MVPASLLLCLRPSSAMDRIKLNTARAGLSCGFGDPPPRPIRHLNSVATIICQHDCAVLKRSGLSKIAQIVQ